MIPRGTAQTESDRCIRPMTRMVAETVLLLLSSIACERIHSFARSVSSWCSRIALILAYSCRETRFDSRRAWMACGIVLCTAQHTNICVDMLLVWLLWKPIAVSSALDSVMLRWCFDGSTPNENSTLFPIRGISIKISTNFPKSNNSNGANEISFHQFSFVHSFIRSPGIRQHSPFMFLVFFASFRRYFFLPRSIRHRFQCFSI